MKLVAAVLAIVGAAQLADDRSFLGWPQREAESIGRAAQRTGMVSGGARLLKTERARDYKLIATVLYPETIRAAIRVHQLGQRLTDGHAMRLLKDATFTDELPVMVELDPREGSGVIPNEWLALLEGRDRNVAVGSPIAARKAPELRNNPALQGVSRRNYDYDRFWVVFPLKQNGQPTIPATASELMLTVRIYNQEGQVKWPLSGSLRQAVIGR